MCFLRVDISQESVENKGYDDMPVRNQWFAVCNENYPSGPEQTPENSGWVYNKGQKEY